MPAPEEEDQREEKGEEQLPYELFYCNQGVECHVAFVVLFFCKDVGDGATAASDSLHWTVVQEEQRGSTAVRCGLNIPSNSCRSA